MNEQEITSAVQAVLDQMKEAAPQHTHKHVCKCKKHQMTLKLANALIEKVKVEAARVGVNAVVAVSDKAGRPVAVQCMDDAYISRIHFHCLYLRYLIHKLSVITQRLLFVKLLALVSPSPVLLAIVNVQKPSPPNPSAA